MSTRSVDEKTGVVASSGSDGCVTDGEVINVHKGDDIAAKYADTTGPLDPKTSRRLMRKADCVVCLMMCFVYTVQFMDKVSNASAAIMGIREDLHMEGTMYSWVGSSFYLGYLVFEIPMNMVLQKFPLARTTGLIICAWGLVMTCSAASQNYPGYIACRTLLGVLEGGITPSFVVLTSQWWKRDEQFSRTAYWFGCNGLGSVLGNAIAYGFLERVQLGESTIAGWRGLFITLGLMTLVIGVVFTLVVPNHPAEAWFYSEEERHQHTARIKENKQGYGTRVFKWYQVREVFIDPRSYLMFGITFFSNLPNGGITNFQSILIKGMNFSAGKSLLISMGGGAVEFVFCALCGLLSLYLLKGYRLVYASVCAALNVLFLALLAYGPNHSAKLGALLLWNGVSPVAFLAVLSSISSNTAGRTKKSIMNSIFLIGYCVGNLIGPQTFKASEAPTYQTATTTMVACAAILFCLIVTLLLLNIWENRRRDRKNVKLPPTVEHAEFSDLTDFENPEFRYAH